MNNFTLSCCRKYLLFIFCFTFCTNHLLAQQYIGRQKVDQFSTTSSGTLTYGLTWLPTDYSSNSSKYPLIIFLHGSGEAGTSVSSLNNLISTALPQKIAQGWNPEAVNPANGQAYKFIVVSPQAPSWSYSYTYLQYILADVISKYRVDISRIYITGLSAGGAGAWSTVTNEESFAKKIAAIISVSGAGTNTPAELTQIPLVGGTYGVKTWSICGTGDTFWTLAQSFTNTINNAPVPPSIPDIATGIVGAGHSAAAWNTAYDVNWRSNGHNLNIYEWMLKSTRNGNSGGNGNNNQSPTANAGADQMITLPVNSIQLSGSGSDPDGSIKKYEWSKVSGPSQYQFGPDNNNNDGEDDDKDDEKGKSRNISVNELTAGIYTFRLSVKDDKDGTATDDITITVNTANATTSPSVVNGYTAIPLKLEAEHWSAMSGVQTEGTADAGGGLNVGWIEKDDWMDYKIAAPSSGIYSLKLRVASIANGAQLQLRKENGSVLATVTLPNTGSWQSWQTVETTLTLVQGNQTLRLYSSAAVNWNVNWLDFSQAAATPPPSNGSVTTRIEAENWNAMSGVQNEPTTDAGGGLNVGWMDNTDWVEYPYTAPVAGMYTLRLRIASGGSFSIAGGSGPVTTLLWNNTGGYQIWQTLTTTVYLSAGTQQLRITTTAGTPNINWLEVVSPSAVASATTTRMATGSTEEQLDIQTEAVANGRVEIVGNDRSAAVIKLYPNPVTAGFTLELNAAYTGALQAVLYDGSGRMAKRFVLNKGTQGIYRIWLSAGGLAAGTYTLSVYAPDGTYRQTTQLLKL